MPIELPCPSCGQRLRVADQHAGHQARCPNCTTVFPVPDSLPETSEQPPAVASAVVHWYAKTTDGAQYGPIEKSLLDTWVREGRITADCQLLTTGSAQWKWASDVYPILSRGGARSQHAFTPHAAGTHNPYTAPVAGSATAETAGTYALPHRAGLVLTFGILGIVICPIFGIFAWVMGQSDLNDMRNGRMDQSGHGMTTAGMVLGIVSVALMALGCCFFFVGAAVG